MMCENILLLFNISVFLYMIFWIKKQLIKDCFVQYISQNSCVRIWGIYIRLCNISVFLHQVKKQIASSLRFRSAITQDWTVGKLPAWWYFQIFHSNVVICYINKYLIKLTYWCCDKRWKSNKILTIKCLD